MDSINWDCNRDHNKVARKIFIDARKAESTPHVLAWASQFLRLTFAFDPDVVIGGDKYLFLPHVKASDRCRVRQELQAVK